MKKVYNPKTLKRARKNIKLDDKELNKESAKIKNKPYCFTDESLKIGFKEYLDSQKVNHTTSLLTNEKIFSVFWKLNKIY